MSKLENKTTKKAQVYKLLTIKSEMDIRANKK